VLQSLQYKHAIQVVRNSTRGRCVSCRRGLVAYFYSAWRRLLRFLRHTCRAYATPTLTERTRACPPIPAKVIALLVPRCDARGFDACVFQQSALITAQAPPILSVLACHSLERTQANPLYLSENLIEIIACPLVQSR